MTPGTLQIEKIHTFFLMLIFTIGAEGDYSRLVANVAFHHWEEVRDDDERVRAFILTGDFHHQGRRRHPRDTPGLVPSGDFHQWAEDPDDEASAFRGMLQRRKGTIQDQKSPQYYILYILYILYIYIVNFGILAILAFILNVDFHYKGGRRHPRDTLGLVPSGDFIFTIGRKLAMMISACAHFSLMVIFTIREAGYRYSIPKNTKLQNIQNMNYGNYINNKIKI